MSGPSNERQQPSTATCPLWLQILAWILGLGACIPGMMDLVAEWSPELASIQFVVLVSAPIFQMLGKRSQRRESQTTTATRLWIDWVLCLISGGIALAVSSGIGSLMKDLPPAYHDEYSYLFQARTLLAGRFSFPSSTVHPELFDQMHILNEGRMASRYYPGTGIWLAPFVAWGHPYLGHSIAFAVATILAYWTARELSGRVCGLTASLAMAVSPGIGLFANMLLAHLPTLVGLMAFLWGITRWGRTRSSLEACIAGCGLSFAMLCRPMTAAAFALPFGCDVVIWLFRAPEIELSDKNTVKLATLKIRLLFGLGIPLIAGWILMLAYNHAITGHVFESPYQLYTDLHTPRHVFGFNNVVRGELHLGPKVIEAYDRWAQNLTLSLAVDNLIIRWFSSWLWTFDLLPLLICSIVFLGMLPRLDRRWRLIGAAIVSQHACHFPYWYAGIMGWHYVFETAPLWCLVLGAATAALFAAWTQSGKTALKTWWAAFLTISIIGVYLLPGETKLARAVELKPPRVVSGISTLAYPRRRHAQFRRWIEEEIDRRPALVLIEQSESESTHLDFVVNAPGLNDEVVFGRFRTGVTNPSVIQHAFPERHVYVVNPATHTIVKYD